MKKGDVVYISGPYSNGGTNSNVQAAIHTADRLRELGLVPFIPHLYHLWDLVHPHNYEYWMDLCLDWVPKCQALLRLPGDSTGADRECALAVHSGVPVFSTIPEIIKSMG